MPKKPDNTEVTMELNAAALTMEMRRRRPENRYTLPTLRVVAGSNMLKYSSVYPGERILIGRDESCDLTLNDSSVSRRHASVTSDVSGQLVLEDLGSTNGTAYNGKPVRAPTLVQVGDLIEVGGITLRIDRLSLEELSHLARVVERLSLATKDPLTGLVTRLYLKDELPGLIQRYQLSGLPLSAIFMDIDYFKRVNDTFGHGTGDEVLRAVARLMALSMRDSDTAVRYGGEEFLAVLPNCDVKGGHNTAERLRASVEDHNWEHYAKGVAVTISLGVAQHRRGESMAQWLRRADSALYSAKRAGRNRVVCAD